MHNLQIFMRMKYLTFKAEETGNRMSKQELETKMESYLNSGKPSFFLFRNLSES